MAIGATARRGAARRGAAPIATDQSIRSDKRPVGAAEAGARAARAPLAVDVAEAAHEAEVDEVVGAPRLLRDAHRHVRRLQRINIELVFR